MLRGHMGAPGFRIIAVSQRLFRDDVIVPEREIMRALDGPLFQYEQGPDVTVVSFNFAFPQAREPARALAAECLGASLFNVNSPTPVNGPPIVEDLRRTRRLVVLGDSKSRSLSCHELRATVGAALPLAADVVLTRRLGAEWLTPVADVFEAPLADMVAALRA